MKRLRDQYDLKPLVIHTNYLVNLAGANELFLKKSVEAFRGKSNGLWLSARSIWCCIQDRFADPTGSKA